MPDYFAALLRSSGMDASLPRASVTPLPQIVAPPQQSELHERAISVADLERHAPLVPQAPDLLAKPTRGEPPSRTASPAVDDDGELARRVIRSESNVTHPQPEPSISSRHPPSPSRGSVVDPAQAIVRAALRWVAEEKTATPLEPPAIVPVASPRREPAVATIVQPARAIQTAKPESARDDAHAIAQEMAATLQPDVPPRDDALRPQAIPARHAVPAPSSASMADDRLEVSIGSIHLRVEAPAPALSAQSTAPAAPRAAVPRTARSGLARRLLYRL